MDGCRLSELEVRSRRLHVTFVLAFSVLASNALRQVFEELFATVPRDRLDGVAAGLEPPAKKGRLLLPRAVAKFAVLVMSVTSSGTT